MDHGATYDTTVHRRDRACTHVDMAYPSLATLTIVLTHRHEERRFLVLLTHLPPAWFLVAAGCQVGTYVCAAAVWHHVLRRAGVAIRLRALVPLGLAKLFVDQIVPHG